MRANAIKAISPPIYRKGLKTPCEITSRDAGGSDHCHPRSPDRSASRSRGHHHWSSSSSLVFTKCLRSMGSSAGRAPSSCIVTKPIYKSHIHMGGCQNYGPFFGYPKYSIGAVYYKRDPKRDHNFDNHPYIHTHTGTNDTHHRALY